MKNVKMLKVTPTGQLDVPEEFISKYEDWSGIGYLAATGTTPEVREFLHNNIMNETQNLSSQTTKVAFYDNGDFELRDVQNRPERCTVFPTQKGAILDYLIKRYGMNMFTLEVIARYRHHFDFANYNPTKFVLSREGAEIKIKFKHEYPYDMFEKKEDATTYLIPSQMGGLTMSVQTLQDEAKCFTTFEEDYTVIHIQSPKHLDATKSYVEVEYFFQSLYQVSNPVKFVDKLYNMGLLDSKACTVPDLTGLSPDEALFALSESTSSSEETPGSEKLAILISEILINCVFYQHSESKCLVAEYANDNIVFYKVSDDEEEGRLKELQIDWFFEDLRNDVDFKQNKIRR